MYWKPRGEMLFSFGVTQKSLWKKKSENQGDASKPIPKTPALGWMFSIASRPTVTNLSQSPNQGRSDSENLATDGENSGRTGLCEL